VVHSARTNPFLLQFLRELVGILHALDVAAHAGVAVPIPGAPDTASGLEDAHGKAHPAQAMQHVHTSETGADDHRIERASLLQLRMLIGHAFSAVLFIR
jgi:hypothetical protein